MVDVFIVTIEVSCFSEEADVVSDGISEQNDYGGDVSDFSSDDSAGGAAEERGNISPVSVFTDVAGLCCALSVDMHDSLGNTGCS